VSDRGKAFLPNISHSYVNLNTDLQAVAVRITLDKTITLCSVYIPPNSSLSLTQLKHLDDQLPTPFIIMGDFNGHNNFKIGSVKFLIISV
jgi:endonuclease/exonuclease/phosphatase family metal-dependent hydrolase